MKPGLSRGLAYALPTSILFWIGFIILLRMIFA